jgi:hypothetical protein
MVDKSQETVTYATKTHDARAKECVTYPTEHQDFASNWSEQPIQVFPRGLWVLISQCTERPSSQR